MEGINTNHFKDTKKSLKAPVGGKKVEVLEVLESEKISTGKHPQQEGKHEFIFLYYSSYHTQIPDRKETARYNPRCCFQWPCQEL